MQARVPAMMLGVLSLAALLVAEEPRTFGKPLTGLPLASLEEVLAKPEAGKVLRLEGTIERVCQNKGCWLELKQGERSIHVTFQGYSFFVPKDATHRAVALEGKVIVKEPLKAPVEHLESEGAGEAASAKVSIEATGVAIQ